MHQKELPRLMQGKNLGHLSAYLKGRSLEEFYPSLAIANFSQEKLEDYLKEAIEGRAWLPKGLYVEYDENQELLITVTTEVCVCNSQSS